MNTVLVVDDEPEVCSTLCLVLSGEGFKAQHATNGHEAIDKYQQLPIDVVITDMRMPEMDGNEIVRQLKQLDEHVVAIMLTASGDLDNDVRAQRVDGVYTYLTKPLENTEVFISAVKGAIENRRLRMENQALMSQLETAKHFSQDMSEMRKAQEPIRLSKIMLQCVFDGISDPLVMVDCNLNVRMFNRAAKNYYHIRDYKDLIGKRIEDVWVNEQQREQSKIYQAVSSGRAVVFERPGHMEEDKIEKVTIYPLSGSATRLDGSIIQITDITETKAIERRIIQNEKLASLGLLVSGVAHEINNPNNFITFNIPILKSYVNAILGQVSINNKDSNSKDWFGMSFDDFSDEIFKLIRNLEHGTHRIADIVDNLRTLVKAETGGKSRHPCDMVKIVRHVDALCRNDIKNYVRIFEVQCPDEFPMVVSDAAALEQILIILLINAAHAANKPDSKIKLTVALLKNRGLKIEVEDNGAGMDDETLKKIFDPFFTTKDPGLGAGLGLSVCHSLVNAMQGKLEVKSVLNSGTVFKVEIPVMHSDESYTPDNSSAPPTGDVKASSAI